jgi:hypothetical protein
MREVRPLWKVLVAVGLSFCAGLLIFYVPERNYRSLPEVWLPVANLSESQALLSLPVKTFSGWEKGVRFLPFQPGETELIIVDRSEGNVQAARCPNLYNTQEAMPSPCTKVGSTTDGVAVYTIRRQTNSYNIQGYMQRGDTLFAVAGLYSDHEAVQYMQRLKKVARRDVDKTLDQNRRLAEHQTEKIKQAKQAADDKKAEAYKRLPYDPVLPATLPADWIQYSAGVSGPDPQSPSSVRIIYKKGSRYIGMTLVPAASFATGDTCGPIPGTDGLMVGCTKAPNEEYYLGGNNQPGKVSQYTFRVTGGVAAILQTTVQKSDGQPMLFSEDILAAQRSIAKSLRQVDKSRLKGAVFIGTPFELYPAIQP